MNRRDLLASQSLALSCSPAEAQEPGPPPAAQCKYPRRPVEDPAIPSDFMDESTSSPDTRDPELRITQSRISAHRGTVERSRPISRQQKDQGVDEKAAVDE